MSGSRYATMPPLPPRPPRPAQRRLGTSEAARTLALHAVRRARQRILARRRAERAAAAVEA